MWSFVIPPKNEHDLLLRWVKVPPLCKAILEYSAPMSLDSCGISFSNSLPRLPVLEFYFYIKAVRIEGRMEECIVTAEMKRKVYERMSTVESSGEIIVGGFLGYNVEEFNIRLYDDLFYVRATISNPVHDMLSFSGVDYPHLCTLCDHYQQAGFKVCSGHLLEAMKSTSSSELYRDTRREIHELLSEKERKEITGEDIDDMLSIPGEGRWKVTLQVVWCSFSVPGENGVEKPSESDWERKMKLKIPLAEKDLL